MNLRNQCCLDLLEDAGVTEWTLNGADVLDMVSEKIREKEWDPSRLDQSRETKPMTRLREWIQIWALNPRPDLWTDCVGVI